MFSSIKFANIRRDRNIRVLPNRSIYQKSNRSIYQKIEHGGDRNRRDMKSLFAQIIECQIEMKKLRIEMSNQRTLMLTLINDQNAKIQELQSQIDNSKVKNVPEVQNIMENSIATELSVVENEPEQPEQPEPAEERRRQRYEKVICEICDEELEIEKDIHIETMHTLSSIVK